MNRRNIFILAVVTAFVAACASVDTRTAEKRDDSGSRIVGSREVKTIGNKQDIQDMMGRGSIVTTGH